MAKTTTYILSTKIRGFAPQTPETDENDENGRCPSDKTTCLGILASLMFRKPVEVKTHLVSLWRYLWTTMDYAMCTLPSPKAAQIIQKGKQPAADTSRAQEGPQTRPRSLKIQTYCDASFAPRGGFSVKSPALILSKKPGVSLAKNRLKSAKVGKRLAKNWLKLTKIG